MSAGSAKRRGWPGQARPRGGERYVRADGASNAGIRLAAGGSVKNDVGGTIFSEGGTGVAVAYTGGVINDGEIAGTVGVTLDGGDFVTNGFINITHVRALGTISGSAYGVSGSTASAVTNFATISGGIAGVMLSAGGTVSNFGAISGISGGPGVYLQMGGSVVNGASGATAALITGGDVGVAIHKPAGTVINFGTISAPANQGDGRSRQVWRITRSGPMSRT